MHRNKAIVLTFQRQGGGRAGRSNTFPFHHSMRHGTADHWFISQSLVGNIDKLSIFKSFQCSLTHLINMPRKIPWTPWIMPCASKQCKDTTVYYKYTTVIAKLVQDTPSALVLLSPEAQL